MRISIAMATYNGSAYIQEQLDSFVRQTRQPDELVVCDDCSTDETMDILQDFREQAPFPVRLYRNASNLGFIKNFEKALSLCSGDILLLSDQDDVWFENRLEIVEHAFSLHPEKMVVLNDIAITTKNLQPTGRTKLGNIRDLGRDETYFMTGCCTAFRRAWLDIALPIPEVIKYHRLSHDLWINTLAEFLGLRVIIEQPLQFYRRHDSNASGCISNSTGRVSRLKLLMIYSLKAPPGNCGNWMAHITYTRLYLHRLEERRTQLQALHASERLEQAIAHLRERLPALEQRRVIAQHPRWRRLPPLLRFWLSGGYRHFAGWKSALKDMVHS